MKPIPYPRSQSLFAAINGFQAQREAVAALAHDTLQDPAVLMELEKLLGRVRSLATKRNRLVHGKWRNIQGRSALPNDITLARLYFPANMKPFTEPGATVHTLKGKYVFFHDDLKRCSENSQRTLIEFAIRSLWP